MDALFEIRGKSSLNQLKFPKMKVEILKEDAAETKISRVFGDYDFGKKLRLKVGTHLGENTSKVTGKWVTQVTTKKYHRLESENEPYREVYPYKALEILGIEPPRAVRAEISYEDTGWTRNSTHQDSPKIKRKAFLYEHRKGMSKRLGWEFLAKEGDTIPESQIDVLFADQADSYHEKLDVLVATRVMLANTLFGNWDYRVPIRVHRNDSEDRLHNIYIFRDENGAWIPVPFDYDLSSIVTGFNSARGRFGWRARSKVKRIMKSNIREIRTELNKVSRHQRGNMTPDKFFQKAMAPFLTKKDSLFNLSTKLGIDKKGIEFIKEHLDAFYEVTSSVAQEPLRRQRSRQRRNGSRNSR